MITKEAIIPRECFGQRTDVVLAQLFPEYSRSQLCTWLKNGAILVEQRTPRPKDKVHGGEAVHLIVEQRDNTIKPAHEAENIPLNIVFEDEHLLVINKPAGLVVHPGAGNQNHTLLNALLYHAPQLQNLPRAGIVHRLDMDTTGLLIVAKTIEAQTDLVRQMQARTIQRRYLALVLGHIISGATITTHYGRDPHNRLKMTVCTTGREAITTYSINRHYQGLTLLNVSLMTGRTHQIRVHMTHIHHPIVGDSLYGGLARIPQGLSNEKRTALRSFKRQALHAQYLNFQHPSTKELLTFTAPIPDDFQELLNLLEIIE